jgi:hypothetical protein
LDPNEDDPVHVAAVVPARLQWRSTLLLHVSFLHTQNMDGVAYISLAPLLAEPPYLSVDGPCVNIKGMSCTMRHCGAWSAQKMVYVVMEWSCFPCVRVRPHQRRGGMEYPPW